MIDLHSHILPQMDDGSRSVDESLQMLAALAAQGVTDVAATPHFYASENSPERFLARRLLPVTFGNITPKESAERFQMLMGKGEAAARRSWMEEHGNEAEADI